MILINQKEEKGKITISLSGHAGYAPRGQDIVCAGVSALFFCLIESLSQISNCKIKEIKENDLETLELTNNDYNSRVLIQSFMIGCMLLANTYPDNIKIDN